MGKKPLMKTYGEINTFIGGVASTIYTEDLVASRFKKYPDGTNITPSHISKFKIIGNDIQFRISVDYSLVNYAFSQSGSTITYFKDTEGRCKEYKDNSIMHSNTRTTIQEVELPGIVKFPITPSNWQLQSTYPNFTRLYVPNCQEWGNYPSLENSGSPGGVIRTSGFPFLANNLVITTSSVNQTSNGGGVEGDLDWMESYAGVTIIYV